MTEKTNLPVLPVIAKIEERQDNFKNLMENPKKFEILKNKLAAEMRKNPKLQDCDPASIGGALMKAIQLDLDIGETDECYLVPRKGVASFQISYKGLIKIAYQTGFVDVVRSEVVYQDDDFEFDVADQKIVKHKPGHKRDFAIGYYAVVSLKTGKEIVKYFTRSQIDMRKEKSASQNFWKNGYDQMAQKVCVREALKLIPKSKITYIDSNETEIGSDLGLQTKDDKIKVMDAELLS